MLAHVQASPRFCSISMQLLVVEIIVICSEERVMFVVLPFTCQQLLGSVSSLLEQSRQKVCSFAVQLL